MFIHVLVITHRKHGGSGDIQPEQGHTSCLCDSLAISRADFLGAHHRLKLTSATNPSMKPHRLLQTVFRQLGRDRRSVRRSQEEVRVEASSKRELEASVVSDWSLRIFENFVSEGYDPNHLSALYPFLHDVPKEIRGVVREAVIDRLVAMVHGVPEESV